MRSAHWRFGTIVATTLLCAGPLGAQTEVAQAPTSPAPTNPGTPAATRTINLTLEQRHVIRELVQDMKVDRSAEDIKVAAGDEIPGKVTLHPVPPLIGQKVPQIRSHRLYITQHQIVIVDPQDQRVVEVIE